MFLVAVDDDDFRRACTVVAAGSVVACVAAILNCHPPSSPSLTWGALLLRPIQYLAATAVAGTAGLSATCMLLATRPRVRRRDLVEHALMGWLFLPGIVLLDRSWPAWALPLFALAAAAMAVGVRLLAPRDQDDEEPLPDLRRDFSSFYGITWAGARPRRALTIALLAEGSLALACAGSYRLAGFLLGAGMFLLLWHWSAEVRIVLSPLQRRMLASSAATLSFLVCLLVLMPWLQQYVGGLPVAAKTVGAETARARPHFGSVILWPPRQRSTQLYFPVPGALQENGHLTRPMQIPFDGPYWYFEAPDESPGPTAHVATGLPTDARVGLSSAAGGPLRMEAVQRLAKPIRYDCCAHLDVQLTDADPQAGALHLGVLLSDSTAPDAQSVLLGFASLAGSESMNFGLRQTPLDGSVRFTFPPSRQMRRFDRITVVILPTSDPSRGSKVAIDGFTLSPQ
jgi:hypothetical protein